VSLRLNIAHLFQAYPASVLFVFETTLLILLVRGFSLPSRNDQKCTLLNRQSHMHECILRTIR